MGNCLVTKLKATVNNDSLPELGIVKLRVNPSTDPDLLTFVNAGGIIEVPEGHTYNDTTGVFSSGSYTVKLKNKYNSTIFKLYAQGKPSVIGCDLEQMSYMTELIQLCIAGAYVEGDLSNLKHSDKITYIEFYHSKIYGDISTFEDWIDLENCFFQNVTGVTGDISCLAKCTKLEGFYCQNTKVSGAVETLVKAQCANGRVSGALGGSCGCDFTNTDVKFNSKALEAKIFVDFSANGATVYGSDHTTVLGRYVKASDSWSYMV